MDQLLRKKRLYQVDVPADSIEEWRREMEKGRSRYGKFFGDNREFEYFWMLPLSDKQRNTLLAALVEEKREETELAECNGSATTSARHRQRCVACVCTKRPFVAVQYF